MFGGGNEPGKTSGLEKHQNIVNDNKTLLKIFKSD